MPSSPEPGAHNPLSAGDERAVESEIIKAFLGSPPTIGVIGVSGTGKSSTINSMFKTDLPISHVAACTKDFVDTNLVVSIKSGQAEGTDATLRVVDAPGLGEDVALDPRYLRMYEENLDRCDVILWVLTARNRAIALDQAYLDRLRRFSSKIVFGINQCDLVEPLGWSGRTNLPSDEQLSNIDLIVADRRTKLEAVLGREVAITPYAANRYWKLQELYESLVFAAPKQRVWMFEALKAFSYDTWIPEGIRDQVRSLVEKPTRRSRGLFGK